MNTVTKKEKIGVFKFGGASVYNEESISCIKDFILYFQQMYEEVYIILSAPKGQTKELREIYNEHHKDRKLLADEIVKYLVKFWFDKFNYVELDHLGKLLFDVKSKIINVPERMLRPYCLHLGEYLTINIVNQILKKEIQSTVIDTKDVLFTTNTNPEDEDVYFKVSKKLFDQYKTSDEKVFFIPGFYGHNNDGITLFNFDGSDYTAIIIAKLLNIKKVFLFKNFGDNDFNLKTSRKLDANNYAKTVGQKAYNASKALDIEIVIRNINNLKDSFIYTES